MHDMHLDRISERFKILLTKQKRLNYSEINHINNWNQIAFILNIPIHDQKKKK